MVLSALILTAIAAGVPWGVFYLMLWIAQGFREIEKMHLKDNITEVIYGILVQS